MGQSSSFAEAAGKIERAQRAIADMPKSVGHRIGKKGKAAMLDQARHLFGADRAFSGAARSRRRKSIRRPVNARYVLRDDTVTIYPYGPPIYIFARGRRGGAPIRPTGGRRALLMPGGEYRASSRVGTLTARPDVIDPVVQKMEREAPRDVAKAVHTELTKVF